MQPISSTSTLRHRTAATPSTSYSTNQNIYNDDNGKKFKNTVKKLDFFPKVERDMTVRTEHGGECLLKISSGWCVYKTQDEL